MDSYFSFLFLSASSANAFSSRSAVTGYGLWSMSFICIVFSMT